MDGAATTQYSHLTMGDVFNKEHRARELAEEELDKECHVYGTVRSHYRPRLGISGTLQSTPNPNLEFDRHFRPDEAGYERQRVVELPRLDLDPFRPKRPNRKTEANLNEGVPPHQVHHHHFGWTMPGFKPDATNYNPRRKWGLGLEYSEKIVPTMRRVSCCPDTVRATSWSARASTSTVSSRDRDTFAEAGSAKAGSLSWRKGRNTPSTMAPSDLYSVAASSAGRA
mmetsp:Transcript_62635/g.123814  ORF Transcript_62635/g.123814 Transcript_62635/m.123814 type:complete len:226 (-) Transcript_62635:79-756(-)|eukprot:CAMPEP_0172726752 /NCGR_PEP_ID=MMETSP1074-20121228/91293_1 /TAXON_ID=2916 /ORGANISM="Ceratium fusus, Strain PA161109" /LENGTH=225 /DNA_ID=CAMNT_0013553841 /DNA_START=59 /DNA_END=736 /DNA_ORIENTATION=-